MREKTGLDKIKEGLKVLSGDSKARIERAKEKLRAEVKRIAKEARYLASPNQCLGSLASLDSSLLGCGV